MILLDVHPASYIDADGREHSPVRAVVTTGRLRVWRSVGRDCELLIDEPHGGVRLESRHPRIGHPIDVPLTVGTVQVIRSKGCGCGSPLKALRPPGDDD